MKEKINIKDFFIILICIIFLFQSILQKSISIIKYFDEVVVIFFMILYLLEIVKRKKILIDDIKMYGVMISITIIGLVGNFKTEYQTDYTPIITDMFNVFKVFLAFIFAKSFMRERLNKRTIINCLAKIVRGFILIAFLCCIINLFKDIGMSKGGIRYGIRPFSFIFSNAGVLALYIYMYLFILTLDLKYAIKENKNVRLRQTFIIFTLIIWLATLRTRGFVFIILYILSYLKLIKKKKFTFKWRYIILAVIIAVPIGYESFSFYFIDTSKGARSAFFRNSIQIVKDEFPIGTGFATYGTDMAYKYYSRVYFRYGMDTIYGLSMENGLFSHDTYWPAIAGQFGISGLILMVYMIILFYKNLYKKSLDDAVNLLDSLFVIYVTAMSSIATATFFNFATVGWFFLIPLMYDDKV